MYVCICRQVTDAGDSRPLRRQMRRLLSKFKRRLAWQVNAENVLNELMTLSKRSDTQATFLAQHKDSHQIYQMASIRSWRMAVVSLFLNLNKIAYHY